MKTNQKKNYVGLSDVRIKASIVIAEKTQIDKKRENYKRSERMESSNSRDMEGEETSLDLFQDLIDKWEQEHSANG